MKFHTFRKLAQFRATLQFKKDIAMQGGDILYVQWGKKVFSQAPFVQVLPLKKKRPVIFIICTLQL